MSKGLILKMKVCKTWKNKGIWILMSLTTPKLRVVSQSWLCITKKFMIENRKNPELSYRSDFDFDGSQGELEKYHLKIKKQPHNIRTESAGRAVTSFRQILFPGSEESWAFVCSIHGLFLSASPLSFPCRVGLLVFLKIVIRTSQEQFCNHEHRCDTLGGLSLWEWAKGIEGGITSH